MNDTLENTLDPLRHKATRCKHISLASLIVLIALYAAQFIWIGPNAHLTNNSPQWFMLAIYVIPLLLFAPGMLTEQARTYAWFCFILMLYFCDTVITAFAVPHTLGYLGIAESLTVVVLFSAAMYAAKWYGLIANNGISNRKKKKSNDQDTKDPTAE